MSKIILNSMPNGWRNQTYVRGFDYEFINFKTSKNMFEHMEISETIYEGVLEPFLFKKKY